LSLFVFMIKDKPKNYPNVRVSPETFEILGYLKEERGSSYDSVIRDMLSEFAPFLVMAVSHRNDPKVVYVGDREQVDRYNTLLGAKLAYAEYWIRVKGRQDEELARLEEESNAQKVSDAAVTAVEEQMKKEGFKKEK
jgi:hypothetical protein